ncbi:MAG: metalloregulator ArsR/SmtB family transcription factor [Lachnospiraceae bacterium]|nr:metalloregulator ArsR/SmtB family transcription factor [Lachnospiraceae bacterium]
MGKKKKAKKAEKALRAEKASKSAKETKLSKEPKTPKESKAFKESKSADKTKISERKKPVPKSAASGESIKPMKTQAGPDRKLAEINGEQIMLAIFRALSDENRVKILNLLSEREMCTSELLDSLDIVQSTMSHHMKVLCETGLVSSRKEGKRTCYTIRVKTVEQMENYIEKWKQG